MMIRITTDFAPKLMACVEGIESAVTISRNFFGYFLSRKESNLVKLRHYLVQFPLYDVRKISYIIT